MGNDSLPKTQGCHMWTPERLKILRELWPHYGTYEVAAQLNLRRPQVKSKVDKLGLVLLPKHMRMCIECRVGHQKARNTGLRCHKCHLQRRKHMKAGVPVEDSRKGHVTKRYNDRERWMAPLVNTTRMRGGSSFDLSLSFLLRLWDKQKGLCYYTGLPMLEPRYGTGRIPDVASLDRVEPSKGYTKGNVVWVRWCCNMAKGTLSVSDFIKMCRAVADHTCGDVLAELADAQKQYTLRHSGYVPEGPLRDRLLASGDFQEES